MTTSSSERSERGVSLGMPELPAPAYPDDVRARLETDAREVIARYPDSRSALLPLLHLVQSEEGHVTRTGMRFCAEMLDLTTAEVTAVATFYTMYRRRPSGDYQVGVCTNTLCAVMGGDAIFEEIFHPLAVRLVRRCDGCLRIGGASQGADMMVRLARAAGRRVFMALDEVPEG